MDIRKRIRRAKMRPEPETIVRIFIGTYDPNDAIDELVTKRNAFIASGHITEADFRHLLMMLACWEMFSFSIRHEVANILDDLGLSGGWPAFIRDVGQKFRNPSS